MIYRGDEMGLRGDHVSGTSFACPELSPDELLNQDVETDGLGKSCPGNRTEK